MALNLFLEEKKPLHYSKILAVFIFTVGVQFCCFAKVFASFCVSPLASVVTHSQLKTMLSNRDIQLFDVRNPDEHQAGRILEAVNIPLGTLEESLQLSPELFQQKFEVKAPQKDDDNIVFHCVKGNRSLKALDIAHRLGFSRARHYKGGYTEWVEKEGK
uniref:Thiosulfate sulfurtransferase/rhodanese-like domain-containing protein 1 n=1 Tax=Acanthochromis polyacanthus TaxID=80966 RepID=A0A3Q1EA19_9TELE